VPGTPEERLTVEPEAAGLRLDIWLARRLPRLSRARLKTLIDKGHVAVDGRPSRPSARVRAGQAITVRVPAPVPLALQAEDIPLSLVHEDRHLLVVDKPAGLVVHPGAGRRSGTLVNALIGRVAGLSSLGGAERPGIVHRLDRGTSGLLVVALDDETHRALARQFASRSVVKEYLALVHGVPRARAGEITAPIGRDPVHRKRMSVRARRGREARTSWTLEEAFEGASLLRVRIHTGRTHQIRVHLASTGHPVVGDTTYGRDRSPEARHARLREAVGGLERPALHAARLAFSHPATGADLAFVSPLPADIAAVLARLRAGRPQPQRSSP
jgi:23S rRNA pseudouridine1911/1915/1917 synthase